MMWYFNNPNWAWAYISLIIPPIIHLFGQRRRNPVDIPSLNWLVKIHKSNKRRSLLKDIAVLILRMLIIFFAISSLAGIRWRTTESNVLFIDNYPAFWSDRTKWLSPMINSLPQEDEFNLWTRGATFWGSYTPKEISEILISIPSSIEDAVIGEDHLTFSYGFEELSPDSTTKAILLPKRVPHDNLKILTISNSSEGTVHWRSTRDTSINWILSDTSGIIADHNGVDYLVQVKEFKSINIKHFGDEVTEDNVLHLKKLSPNKSIAIYTAKNWLPIDDAVSFDSVIEYQSALQLSYLPENSTLFLFGFDFVPDGLGKAKGIFRFYPESNSKPISGFPELKDKFYEQFFIGASLSQNWPGTITSTKLSDTLNPLLFVNSEVVAGYYERNNQLWYEQAFCPSTLEHPYYKALIEWSEQYQHPNELNFPWLGMDEYIANTSQYANIIDNFEMETPLESSDPKPSWSLDKIGLVIALLCAVLALIFAKI